MPVAMIDLVFALLLTAVGLAGGCWLGRRSVGHAARRHEQELRRTREVQARVNELTSRVASDVNSHSDRVKQINDDLLAAEAVDGEAVVASVAKLVAVNEAMRQRLAEAEDKLQEQARELETQAAQARTDPLTGVANRRALDDEIARRFAEFERRGASLSVLMLDVDHFKQFNDTHGHHAGDEVLRGIARVLRQITRGTDLVARYGGEEFAVSLPGTPIADARQAAERARQAIAQTAFRHDGRDHHVTVSIGVAQLLANENTGRLLRRTDEAMYAAKQAGRNLTRWHDGRRILPVSGEGEEAAAPPAPAAPAAASPPPPACPPPAAPAAETPLARAAGWDAADLPANQCDRTAFCLHVRRRIAEWKRGGGAFCVLMVRINHYDQIVKACGQEAGELVLRTTNSFLNAAVREMDLVGRYDPACFSLLLARTRLSEAAVVAERVRQAAASCDFARRGPAQFSLSQGFAEVTEGDDVVRLMQRAEEALAGAEQGAVACHNGLWAEPVANLSGAMLSR